MAIRQPILTVCGHVDHGKTSLLDRIRGSKVAEKEHGMITQKISFTLVPAENIKKSCLLIDKYGVPLKIPGFLFIDTPGHAAFTNLRKRGGSLADLAIVVIDINEGVMPQTSEVLQILRVNKTPFIVAINKIDSLSGWRKLSDDIKENIESQPQHIKQNFDEKIFTIMAALNSHGFESDLFYNVKDYTKKLCLVPCSAKTGEGIQELLMVLCGLSQKFLEERLKLDKRAKGVIFEIKKEKALQYIEAILYDGELKIGDEIVIATFEKPILTKVKVLEEVLPLSEKFKPVEKVSAATGIKMQVSDMKGILPGMPFQIYRGNMSEIEKEFKKEIGEVITTDREGVIIKSDSLGSLEALRTLLKQNNINILKAGIGSINKKDIIEAKANKEINPLYCVILGFNVDIEEEAKEFEKEVKIIRDEVVYKIIENFQKWIEEEKKRIEREKLSELVSICKLEILPQYIFRNSNPAIFGVRVIGGRVVAGTLLIDEKNEKIGKVKGIQAEKKSIESAEAGMEVAISVSGVTFDRQLKNVKYLFSDLSEEQFKEFKKNKDVLTSGDIKVLQEITNIKRREKPTWGI
ncbi:MAG: translation initiation factor IF-2 [Candidatus Pacearchaeota archaeon]